MQPGESYGISYRILLPVALHNVLTCGRCVSTDRRPGASLRVIPGCFITGQASGIAAAIAVAGCRPPRPINRDELRLKLTAPGVFMHNPPVPPSGNSARQHSGDVRLPPAGRNSLTGKHSTARFQC